MPSKFSDNALNGLQVEGKRELHRIAIAVSASEAIINKAVQMGYDALVVHHGLFWKKDSVAVKGSLKSRLKPLLEHEIALYAYHLPLDAHLEIGNNWKAARDLNWSALTPFGNASGALIGVRGEFAPIDCHDFQKSLEEYFCHKATVAAFGKAKISKAALLSGGGYRWLEEAISAGVDAFITGSFDEPAWSLAQEGNIHFYALGHFATERVGPRALAERIQKQLSLEVHFLDEDNPF